MPNEVFISYSSIKDLNGTVTEFHKYLENEIQINSYTSNTIFLDAQGIREGNNWGGTLSSELDQCMVLIILLSPSWLHSEWCKKEYLYFKSLQKPGNRKVIIPIRWANTTVNDANNNPEETDIINELNELQQVNWLQLRYDRNYKSSETLSKAVGELGAAIADFIKGATVIIKYPFGFEEKVKRDESNPALLEKRKYQATILTNFIPTWLIAENEFEAIGCKLTDDEVKKIKNNLRDFITMSISDYFSTELFKTNYDSLPEVEAILADFRFSIQVFKKDLTEMLTKDDAAKKAIWEYLLKAKLSQLRSDAIKIQEAAQKIVNKAGAALV